MDAQSYIRNLRDFLLIYNQMTENCFARCAFDMNYRTLNRDEAACIDRCSTKFIATNHRVMSIYVDVQSALMNKRIQEAEKAAEMQQNS